MLWPSRLGNPESATEYLKRLYTLHSKFCRIHTVYSTRQGVILLLGFTLCNTSCLSGEAFSWWVLRSIARLYCQWQYEAVRCIDTIRFFKINRFDRYNMLFLGIIAIQILQVMVISGNQTLLEFVYLKKYSIPTKPESGSSPFDLWDLPDLAEMLLVKTRFKLLSFRTDSLWAVADLGAAWRAPPPTDQLSVKTLLNFIARTHFNQLLTSAFSKMTLLAMTCRFQ